MGVVPIPDSRVGYWKGPIYPSDKTHVQMDSTNGMENKSLDM